MKILVFLHGTTIMHASAVGKTREQRVRQVVNREPGVADFSSYVPTEAAVAKLQNWSSQGATIVYLTSHRKLPLIELDAAVLRNFGFPQGEIVHRGRSRTYADVASQVKPDVLLEDDCESIGGPGNMVYPTLHPALQARIRSIVVPEFGGLAHLPDDPSALK